MIKVTPFNDLGSFQNDWLNAHYHFSFAGYYDPEKVGHGNLLVWNDDTIEPGTGFDPHGHRDMEIITYVRKGAITHRDNMGNEGRTVAGDIQVMSAGTGVVHAEYNLEEEPTTIFQIWIQPDQTGLAPTWEARKFPKAANANGLEVLASGHDDDILGGALTIRQKARLLGGTLKAGTAFDHALAPGTKAYLVPAEGTIRVNGQTAEPRAGVQVEGIDRLTIEAESDAEVVLVELAA